MSTDSMRIESELPPQDFRLPLSLHDDPRVIKAGNEAVGLWLRCHAHAVQHSTDGFIDKSIVALYGNDALAETLVKTGLWRRVRGGWRDAEFTERDSKETRERKTKLKSERQNRWREGRRRRPVDASTPRLPLPTPLPPSPLRGEGAGARAYAREAPPVENPGVGDTPPHGCPHGTPGGQSACAFCRRGVHERPGSGYQLENE